MVNKLCGCPDSPNIEYHTHKYCVDNPNQSSLNTMSKLIRKLHSYFQILKKKKILILAFNHPNSLLHKLQDESISLWELDKLY